MSDVKLSVRILVALMFICSIASGQVLTRRQQALIQRQQKQLDEHHSTLEQQILAQTIQAVGLSSSPVNQKDPNQTPINYAILDSIFNVPIQAIKAVNELVRTLAAVRARLNAKGQVSAGLMEETQ